MKMCPFWNSKWQMCEIVKPGGTGCPSKGYVKTGCRWFISGMKYGANKK
jgi:hypothetical protein